MTLLKKMANRTARIRVPATTSNLGAAFDAVGLALQLYLNLEVSELEGNASSLEFRGRDAQLIPTDRSNLVWRMMEKVAGLAGKNLPAFSLRIENQIPITKGLGSSATACLAGAAAADFLCRLDLEKQRLLEIASAEEGHPDNVAPALFGGLVAAISGDEILCARAEFPAEWTIVAVTPQYELETKKARAALPAQIPHRDAVYNVQRAAFLMAQVTHGRKEGVREAMRDRLHQPYRSALLPGLSEILEMRDMAGLIGVALSGAGSTVVAFADAQENTIGESIREIFKRHGLDSEVRLLKADNQGLVIAD